MKLWQIVGADICHFVDCACLITLDFSQVFRKWTVYKVLAVIKKLKSFLQNPEHPKTVERYWTTI